MNRTAFPRALPPCGDHHLAKPAGQGEILPSSSFHRLRPAFCKKGIHTTIGAVPIGVKLIGPEKVPVTRARCVCGETFITGAFVTGRAS